MTKSLEEKVNIDGVHNKIWSNISLSNTTNSEDQKLLISTTPDSGVALNPKDEQRLLRKSPEIIHKIGFVNQDGRLENLGKSGDLPLHNISQYVGASLIKQNSFSDSYPYPYISTTPQHLPQHVYARPQLSLPGPSGHPFQGPLSTFPVNQQQHYGTTCAPVGSRNLDNLTDLQKRALEVTGFPLINYNANNYVFANAYINNPNLYANQNSLLHPHITIPDCMQEKIVSIGEHSKELNNISCKIRIANKNTSNCVGNNIKLDMRSEEKRSDESLKHSPDSEAKTCNCCKVCCKESANTDVPTTSSGAELLSPPPNVGNANTPRQPFIFKNLSHMSYVVPCQQNNELSCKKSLKEARNLMFTPSSAPPTSTVAKNEKDSKSNYSLSGLKTNSRANTVVCVDEATHQVSSSIEHLRGMKMVSMKAPLKRTKGNLFENKADHFGLAKPVSYTSNNKDVKPHHVEFEEEFKTKKSGDCTNLKSSHIEMGIEDEDRFLPSNLLSDLFFMDNETDLVKDVTTQNCPKESQQENHKSQPPHATHVMAAENTTKGRGKVFYTKSFDLDYKVEHLITEEDALVNKMKRILKEDKELPKYSKHSDTKADAEEISSSRVWFSEDNWPTNNEDKNEPLPFSKIEELSDCVSPSYTMRSDDNLIIKKPLGKSSSLNMSNTLSAYIQLDCKDTVTFVSKNSKSSQITKKK